MWLIMRLFFTLRHLYDFIAVVSAFYVSIILRHGEFTPPLISSNSFLKSLIVLVIVQYSLLYLLKIQQGLWSFTGLVDLLKIIKITSISVLTSVFTLFLLNRVTDIPRTLFVLDWLLLVFFLSAGRIFVRYYFEESQRFREHPKTSLSENIIIIGAGQGGERLIRDIQHTPKLHYKIIGIIEDDPLKQHKRIHGIPVIGTVENLPEIIVNNSVKKVFVAIPSATSAEMSRIVEKINHLSVKIKTLPKMSDLLYGKIDFSQLRNINAEDLLGREEFVCEETELYRELGTKRILITGAGGSIGSEICRRLSLIEPELLIFYEITEYNLYALEAEISSKFPNIKFISILGDVRDREKLATVMEKYKPNFIFHAAAYKHVPIVEKNPSEGIKTNVLGTKIVAETSLMFEVERFVLISTDKAVNPTNIMGASKRTAEKVVQQISQKSQSTKFIIVRFGNVLGSSGSVIPLFKKQIAEGGPVTVTHPDITRFFMSITEAAQLVLQASLLGLGGEIFVLEMGKPVKILDLAQNLIYLAGLTPHEDIKIEFTGLRPGEKLFEELLADKEVTLPTRHPKIRIAKARQVEEAFQNQLINLLQLSEEFSSQAFRDSFKLIIPEYVPQNIPENEHMILE